MYSNSVGSGAHRVLSRIPRASEIPSSIDMRRPGNGGDKDAVRRRVKSVPSPAIRTRLGIWFGEPKVSRRARRPP